MTYSLFCGSWPEYKTDSYQVCLLKKNVLVVCYEQNTLYVIVRFTKRLIIGRSPLNFRLYGQNIILWPWFPFWVVLSQILEYLSNLIFSCHGYLEDHIRLFSMTLSAVQRVAQGGVRYFSHTSCFPLPVEIWTCSPRLFPRKPLTGIHDDYQYPTSSFLHKWVFWASSVWSNDSLYLQTQWIYWKVWRFLWADAHFVCCRKAPILHTAASIVPYFTIEIAKMRRL